MTEQESLPGYPQPAGTPQPDVQEKYNALRAQQISRKWGERLDDFRIPCPFAVETFSFKEHILITTLNLPKANPASSILSMYSH
jgi:hypothetical protein